MSNYDTYKKELERCRAELENDNIYIEQDLIDLEHQIQEELELIRNGDNTPYRKLLKEIKTIKEEFDFYDEEAELNMMFPNRDDDDFDHDSMSYDGVFDDD